MLHACMRWHRHAWSTGWQCLAIHPSRAACGLHSCRPAAQVLACLRAALSCTVLVERIELFSCHMAANLAGLLVGQTCHFETLKGKR